MVRIRTNISKAVKQEITAALRRGEKGRDIAARFGVSESVVTRCRWRIEAEQDLAAGITPVRKGERMALRRQLFVREYLVDRNATQAAIRAGYSLTCASSRASENLRRPEVIAMLNEAMQRQQERCEIQSDAVLREYARIAFADLRQVMRWSDDGVALTPSAALDDDAARTIAEVRTTVWPDGRQRVRVLQYDKLAALNKLAEYLQLFKPSVRVEHCGAGSEATVQFNFQALSTEELEALEGIAARVRGE
ncbi:MAG: terminase small subunit [Armatimonadota bacterium]